jgi:hypothetical protein
MAKIKDKYDFPKVAKYFEIILSENNCIFYSHWDMLDTFTAPYFYRAPNNNSISTQIV